VEWRGKVAVVTGASSGIGWATARALAKRGCTIVGVARRKERLEALARDCQVDAPDSSFLDGDLGQREFAERTVLATCERHGRIDVLVNNAAIPVRKLLYRMSVEEAEDAIRINFLSCLWTTFAAIPPMLRQGGGTIVNVSSFASKVVPTHETMYAAAKCALNGFSEGLWNDLRGSNIHVALVHPGPIDTEIWHKGSEPDPYRGRRYPPELVAEGIIQAIERGRYEVTIPRRNPTLVVARTLRLLLPGVLRFAMARFDGVRRDAIEQARLRSKAGLRLGEDS
jgi:short-subunit dehydrogenase